MGARTYQALQKAIEIAYNEDKTTISIMLTKTSHKRTVLLYPDEDGYIIAEVPSLPGCISQGRTREEALENIQEAIALHIEVLQERGESIPEDRIEVALPAISGEVY